MTRSIERKIALAIVIAEVERNPELRGGVIVPCLAVLCHDDGLRAAINSLDFLSGHSYLRLARQFLGRWSDSTLVLVHFGCAPRAQERCNHHQQKNLLHRL